MSSTSTAAPSLQVDWDFSPPAGSNVPSDQPAQSSFQVHLAPSDVASDVYRSLASAVDEARQQLAHTLTSWKEAVGVEEDSGAGRLGARGEASGRKAGDAGTGDLPYGDDEDEEGEDESDEEDVD